MTDYLAKPVDVAALHAALYRAVRAAGGRRGATAIGGGLARRRTGHWTAAGRGP